MEASDVIAIVAVAVAAISALFALIANMRAKDALDLQTRIDERLREFQLVRWSANWNALAPGGAPTIWLRNTGVTSAVDVTLLVNTFAEEKLFHFNRVEPGDKVEAVFEAPDAVQAGFYFLRDAPYRVHWTSPRGNVHQVDGTISSGGEL
ncbi:hypothetical protein [Microbacterium sp. SLBN-111]|uniref:hypothetical protein n=1 Tax=Microbacterium sp. SLBN-111 TaxID=3377733 RepID=UPI003C78816D